MEIWLTKGLHDHDRPVKTPITNDFFEKLLIMFSLPQATRQIKCQFFCPVFIELKVEYDGLLISEINKY